MSQLRTRIIQVLARPWFGPVLIALLAAIVVVAAVDPAGDYPASVEGPGLTLDEIFNVDIGARIADRVLSGDIAGTIRAGRTLPDHPPLGRLWLGLFHESVLLVDPPAGQHAPIVVAAARVGSAVAFGILIWLIGIAASKWYGNAAGWIASLSLVLMPRVFGHAHLASLETVLNLTYTLAILTVAKQWSTERAPTARTAAVCGLWLGLALLSKIQAVFIPIPIIVWALINWRTRALLPLMVWGAVGLLVFFCGWPWLWPDPIGNSLKYLGHASDRSSIQVWYLGHAYADKAVPWHYPWVIFLTTIPAGLQFFGIWGIIAVFQRQQPRSLLRVGTGFLDNPSGELCAISATMHLQREPPHLKIEWLFLFSFLFPLIVFSLPGVSIYDGERLFLIVYPLWSIFIARGFIAGWQWLTRRMTHLKAAGLAAVFFAIQAMGLWQMAPCWLSYYNFGSASKFGLQPTYWGDSVTRKLWQQTTDTLPPNSTLDVHPVLHQFQLPAWESQCPMLRAKQITLKPYDPQAPSKYLLVFYRREYLPQAWQTDPPGYVQKFAIIRGDKLAALFERQQ